VNSTVQWTDWSGRGLDRCLWSQNEEGASLEGVVIGTREGEYGAHYLVRTDALFRTRELRFEYLGGPRLHLVVDELGRWRDMLRDQPVPALDGCLDVDIGATPSTNTLPIRRLCLVEQASAKIEVAYVPLPSQIGEEFLPTRAQQQYTCLASGRRYRYDGIFRGFTAELEVDADLMILDYPKMFRRITRD
jgi:hypothetical protein